MSELQQIETTLTTAARRRRLARAIRGFCVGLLVGCTAYLLGLAIYKLAPVSDRFLFWATMISFACPGFGGIAGFWRRNNLTETARWVDVQQNLKERMSTALEVSHDEQVGTWRELVLADAANHVGEIEPRKLVPYTLHRATRWAVVVLAAAVGLGFVPEYRSKNFRQQKADAEVIKEAGRKVAELTRRELQQRPPTLETTKQSLDAVSDLGDLLAKKSLTRSDALKDLANVSDKLKDQLKDLAKDPALKKLEQAARSPSGNDGQSGNALQKQIDRLQKELGKQSGNSEALDKLKNELDKLQEAAKGMDGKTGDAADAERQKLAAQLAALSQQAAEMGASLPQLDEAVEALAAQNTSLFLKDLEAASMDLEKLRDMAKKLEQLQAAAEKIGRDLAEQLKNGQAEMAAQTLDKLARQLKSANLSQEQLDKILKEVTKAVPESKDYGKVEDLLKQACKQGQQGDKSGASDSLAAAARELEDLLQKMGDAQSLMASLENLDRASMCVGTCQRWGMCQGKGGFNPFGQNPGGGVGTWGADGGEWQQSGDWTAHTDNSGITRPDMEGKGITEREQKDLSDVLTPDKVRGQFSPGGQMPSITLKGVSIKGQSTVAYEESVATAQTDAQNALSQQKVPRAYQGAVRDYFDDLKE